MSSWIHWHEGLFLQPHHLQRFQRSFNQGLVAERQLTWAYPHGVVEMRISDDDLANRRVRFERLRVVLKSGVVVDFPDHAEIPTLDLKQALGRFRSGFVVSLGVPFYDELRANVHAESSTGSRARVHYVVDERDHRDENTGDNPKPVPVRKINASLVLPDDDLTNLETIPLLRVVPGVGQEIGTSRQDPDFAPPTMVLRGSPALRKLVYDLAAQVEASRESLVIQINQGGFNMELLRGTQMEQLLRLRTLNHFAARLPLLSELETATPFDIFLELHSLLGELSALNPTKDAFKIGRFDHENPLPVFKEISGRIRELLKPGVSSSYLKLDFESEDDFLAVNLNEEHLSNPNDYFLGIETREEHRAVTLLVEDPDRFKLMPKALARRPIYGIKLKEERVPPPELPAKSNLKYYRVLRSESGRMWDMLVREKSLALRWPGMRESDFKVSLYMTVPL